MPRTAQSRGLTRSRKLLDGEPVTDNELWGVLALPVAEWLTQPSVIVIRSALNELLQRRAVKERRR